MLRRVRQRENNGNLPLKTEPVTPTAAALPQEEKKSQQKRKRRSRAAPIAFARGPSSGLEQAVFGHNNSLASVLGAKVDCVYF